MNPEDFTTEDAWFLLDCGIATSAPTRRSDWLPERLLQQVADGEVIIHGLDDAAENAEVIQLRVDGRAASFSECDTITDLVFSDHVVFVGCRVALTGRGRDTLARWSRFRPCTGGDQ